jgi:hypothetical protein
VSTVIYVKKKEVKKSKKKKSPRIQAQEVKNRSDEEDFYALLRANPKSMVLRMRARAFNT